MKSLRNLKWVIMGTILFFSASVFTQAQNVQYNISQESTMKINGTSNVHDWEAEVKSIRGTVVSKEKAANPNISGLDISNVMLIIPAKQILSDNSGMNRRIHDALKADEHAHIIFRLQSVKFIEDAGGNNPNFIAKGTINIAGETKTIEVELKGQVLRNGNLRFTGTHKLKMSDYNVERPTAMLGSVRAGDEVEITFNLLFTNE